MSASAAPAVEFRAVTKRYGAVVAVDSVSFTIDKGAMVTLLGPSGCGKTTTLRLIAGLEIASEGTILIDGTDVTQRPPTARDVSMVFQSYALFPHMSVLRNVAYGLVAGGQARSQADRAVREALDMIGLAGLEDRLPSELSGGQQQRVAVARAIVLHPAVLLFDEPLSNLDARLRRRVRDEISDLQQRLGLTAVYVTHDQTEALAVSDRIIVMDQARIAQQGSPRDLYREPASRFIAGFVGEANVVDANLLRRDEVGAVVSLGDIELRLPHRGLTQGPVQIAIRPEAIHIDAGQPATPVLPGRIVRALFLGDHMEYTIETAAGALFVVDHDVDRPRASGTDVHISFRLSGLAVLPRL